MFRPLRTESIRNEAPATAPGDDEAALVERACEGDASAFEAIMRRHNRLLFRTARGIAGDDAEAQDAVQEAWLHAFTRLAAWRGEARLGTWLARIAVNAALDAQRKRGRLVVLDAPAEDDESATPPEPMMSQASDTPDSAAERGELRALLQRAIEALPPIYRSVFMLRAVEELSVDETAYCLRVSDSVVKTRYLRARAMLRDALTSQVLDTHSREAFAFAGARCDAVVAHVLGVLDRRGLIRRH
ncbi:MAG: RNA polymerase sigma factor [Betaproteobacteria bacterium]